MIRQPQVNEMTRDVCNLPTGTVNLEAAHLATVVVRSICANARRILVDVALHLNAHTIRDRATR